MAVLYTQKIDPNSPTGTIGVTATRGGRITLDSYIFDSNGKEMFKWLHVGGAGNLVVEGIDGNPIPYLGVTADRLVPICGFRVLSTATIDSVVYTTTATLITWGGGK